MYFRHYLYKGFIGSSFGIWVGVWGALTPSAQAVQLADRTVYFNHPPRLLEATTTEKGVRVFGAKYYFTLSVPADAGEPLQRVTIAQREAVDQVRFSLDKTQAFADRDREQGLSLGEVTADQDAQTVSVVFNPPVQPGKTVTIRLRPRRNPDIGGVYLFGVTAFPQGKKAHGQFLGFGRLHFYNSSGGFSSFWHFR